MAHTNLFSSIWKTAYQSLIYSNNNKNQKRQIHKSKFKLQLPKVKQQKYLSRILSYIYILVELSGGSKGPIIGHISIALCGPPVPCPVSFKARNPDKLVIRPQWFFVDFLPGALFPREACLCSQSSTPSGANQWGGGTDGVWAGRGQFFASKWPRTNHENNFAHEF